MLLGLGQHLGDPSLSLGVAVCQSLLEALALCLELGLDRNSQLLAATLSLLHDVLATDACLVKMRLGGFPGLFEQTLALAVDLFDLESRRGLDLGQLVLDERVHRGDGALDSVLKTLEIGGGPVAGLRENLLERLGLLDRDLGDDRLGSLGHRHLAQLIGKISEKLIDLLGVVARGGESE